MSTKSGTTAGNQEVELEFWRAIKDGNDPDDFELYVPRTMHAAVAARAADVAGSVEFMAGWYRDGGLQ